MLAALSDRYVIEGELGRGGMAIVFRATDRKHDRPVAIKVMRPEVAAAVNRDRFLREIAIAAKLQHPHILSLIDSGESDGVLYYVAPFLEGETLGQRIFRERRLDVEEAKRITGEVVSALRYAHGRGVLHRDIKPANIMLTGGHAVVMDFGIALALDNPSSRLTSTGMMIGTPAYMSPDQLSGESDARSDIYAVGCILYEMLTGAPPFNGPTAQSILLQHVTKAVPPIASLRSGVPESIERLVMRALAKNPEDRFQDMSAVHDALSAAAAASASPSVAPPGNPMPANPEASDLYLRAAHSFDKRTPRANLRAIELLEEATDRYPYFAPAWAQLAAAYIEEFFTHDPDEKWEEKAFAAIEWARGLDPKLPYVYVAKGNLLWTRARRFPHADAIAEYRKALAIDPDNVGAMNELGRVYWHIGWLDEAAALFERTVALDSSLIDARFRLAWLEQTRGNYERSLELFRMVPIGSLSPSTEALTALTLHYLGRTEEGRDMLASVDPALRDDAFFASVEAIFLALDGDRDGAESRIALAIEKGRELGHFHHSDYNFAVAHAVLGETAAAIQDLERAGEGGFPCYAGFERDPMLVPLRNEPRFISLMNELRSRWENRTATDPAA